MENKADVIAAGYNLRDDRITNPGKFEGELWQAVVLYDWYLNGMQDDHDEDGNPVFDFDSNPALGLTGRYSLETSNDGFVFLVYDDPFWHNYG